MIDETLRFEEFAIADYGQAVELWKSSPGVGLSSADSPAAIEAFLAKNPGLSQIARLDGVLVGTALCGSDGRRGYLYHLAVSREYSRKGIGKQLVERCMSRLFAQGVEKCHILVFSDNPYRSLFWQPTGWTMRRELVVYSKSTSVDQPEGRGGGNAT